MSKKIDWDAIRRSYRTGQYTFRQLSEEYRALNGGEGPDHSTIQRRAKKEGWIKDLSADIANETKARLQRHVSDGATDAPEIATANAPNGESAPAAGSNAHATSSCNSDRAVVQAAAEANVQVVLGHRQTLRKSRAMIDALQEQIDLWFNGTDQTREEVEKLLFRSKTESAVFAFGRVLDMIEKQQKLERQAFGVDNGEMENEQAKLDEVRSTLQRRLSRIASGSRTV